MAKIRGIDDAGDELSYKRKGRKGKADAKGMFVTWMTKAQFNKENPDLVPDWQGYRDAGAPFHVVSLAHRYYRGIHALKSSTGMFPVDFEQTPENLATLDLQVKLYEKFVAQSYQIIDNMIQEGIRVSKIVSLADNKTGTDVDVKEFVTIDVKDSSKRLRESLADVRAGYGDAFNKYSNFKRNMSAYSYYLRPLDPYDMLFQGDDARWAKIISPTRIAKPKGDDNVHRPTIGVFDAEYTGSIEIPDIAPEDWSEHMVKTFGLKGMEFGIWNNQTERLKFIHECYTGLMELAGVLNIEPSKIGMDGRLGLAIGARGRGKASAHFSGISGEEGIINLTRTKGVGALAHEYGHAMDFFGCDNKEFNERRFLSDTTAKNNDLFNMSIEGYVPITDKKDAQLKIEVRQEACNEAVGKMWGFISRAKNMSEDDRATVKQIIRDIVSFHPEKRNPGYYEDVESVQVMHDRKQGKSTLINTIVNGWAEQRILSSAEELAINDFNDDLLTITNGRIELNKLKYDVGRMPYAGKSSQAAGLSMVPPEGQKYRQNSWYSQSRSLDSGRKKKYWSSEREMWARLFETWVYHKLQDKGIVHDTLVSGVCHADYHFNKCPYPTKEDGSLDAFLAGVDQIILKDNLFSEAFIATKAKVTTAVDAGNDATGNDVDATEGSAADYVMGMG